MMLKTLGSLGPLHGFRIARRIEQWSENVRQLNEARFIPRFFARPEIEAELEVYEGQSHAQYARDDRLPETREAFGEIAAFFDKHLGH